MYLPEGRSQVGWGGGGLLGAAWWQEGKVSSFTEQREQQSLERPGRKAVSRRRLQKGLLCLNMGIPYCSRGSSNHLALAAASERCLLNVGLLS